MSRLSKFFAVKALATNAAAAVISIRGVIGDTLVDDGWFWTSENTEDQVLAELAKIPLGTKIHVHVNSEGGDMQCALGIRNAFSPRAADITIFNDGYMCSSAAILAPKGAVIICPISSFVMIHRPFAEFKGNDDDAESAMNALRAHNDVYSGIISELTGQPKDEIFALMKAETWWTGEQALAMKYATASSADADDVIPADDEDIVVQARASKIFGRFKNVPSELRQRISASAPAGNPPPTQQQPTKVKSMNRITAALVATGITGLAADANEDHVLPHITAMIGENARLKTENQAFLAARKARVSALLDTAVTENVIAESRKANLLNLGTTSAEGETEVFAQIGELRAATATKTPRGARPAKFVAEGASAEEISARIEELQVQIHDQKLSPAVRAAATRESIELRGYGNIGKSDNKN